MSSINRGIDKLTLDTAQEALSEIAKALTRTMHEIAAPGAAEALQQIGVALDAFGAALKDEPECDAKRRLDDHYRRLVEFRQILETRHASRALSTVQLAKE